MGFGKKIAGLSLSILMLTYEFHAAILVLALADSQTGAYTMSGGTGNIEFLRRQLEKGTPPEGPLLERSYVVPSKVNRSLADKIWLTIAPLISLGYDERGIVNALSELGLPERIEVEGIIVLPDYANLCILRNLENGEIYVDIPIICNSTLSSTYYEVKGIKKHIKLYNVTSLKYYDVSLNACELYNVTYRKEVGEFSKAILNLNGDLKNNVINIYFPDLESPVFSELRIDFPSYGITLSLKVLERRVQKFNLDGKETSCSWIHVNRTLRASRDVWGVMLGIGHGGGWIPMLWPILRKGKYVSDHWIRWIEGERLAVEFSVKEFKSIFVLNFNKTANTEKAFLSKVLSEDELKSLLEQTPFEKLNLSRTPKGWNVRFIGEEVTNETVWVTRKKYEQLARLGWREGNSIFIDSGETEWEYTVTNRDLGKCKSIRLFYNPLKVNKGELVHGLTLRNYANANVSYMLRLRTTSNYFFFFFKVEEGNRNIIVNKAATSSVLLVQQEPAVGDAVLELVKDGRVVTAVKVSLMLKATVFWKGFWDGLASKLPGIIVTAGVMIAMSFLIPHAYVRPAYYLLFSLGVLMNLVEVAFDIEEAYRAREEMLELAKTFENRSSEFLVRGEAEHAIESMSFALALRKELNETIDNLWLNVLSDLTIGLNFDEMRIALGLKEPLARDEFERQYKIGYARGRVTGAVISCMLYVVLFVMVNRVKTERIGQSLNAGQILKMMVKGIYNWITPSVWDAICLVIGREGAKFLGKAVDLLLGNKYSRKFGEAIGDLVESVRADPPRVDEALDASSGLSKQVLENVPSKESSSKILDAMGSIVERYSLEEMKEKGGTVARSIISMWIKDGDEAIDSLNSWLSVNTKNIGKMKALDDILIKIGGDATKGVGLEIGDIVDTYLKALLKSGEQGEEVANRFLEIVFKHLVLLNELKDIDYSQPKHIMGIFNALDYVIKRDMCSIEDIRLEETYQTVMGHREVDVTFVKKVKEIEEPYIIIEVKTGVEARVAKETLEQVDKDALLIWDRKCTAYYYFDQAPSERGAIQYLGKIRQVYLNEKLYGKMFVIIGGGEPVAPTDPSLDAYILNPPEG